jgi:hypothetical protein
VVILAASACESARCLLNSKTSRFQTDFQTRLVLLENTCMILPVQTAWRFVPSMVVRKRYNEDGVGGLHVYSPWWLDNAN